MAQAILAQALWWPFTSSNSMNYEVLNAYVAYSGKILSIEVDEIRYLDTGRLSCREVVVKDAFAMVVAVRKDGSVVLVRQFRHPFRAMALSFPAGRVDPGEAPEEAARRELREEAGLQAARLTKLAELHEVPEFARSVGHLFLAEGLEPSPGAERDDGEATMQVLRSTPAELQRMVRDGTITSVTVVAAWHHFLEFRAASQREKSLGLALGLALAFALGGLIVGRQSAQAGRSIQLGWVRMGLQYLLM
uniref:Nudix hydrolase domain-containing protein n=1 Tax=Pyrodinium bahamense TaxID=73915 RepID=A0A7S0FFF9_9DINO